MNWKEQLAVVTGSSTGIGSALVKALEQKGARVSHCSRSGANGGIPCDVRHEGQVQAFAERVLRTSGTPTLLVNNAGIAKWGSVAEMPVQDWNDVIATNVTGMFLMTRAFLPAMLKAGHGTIINVASLAGRNGIAGGSAYSASKHAVLGFSKSLMLEVRKNNLRVMAVCPGSVDTPIFTLADAPFATDPSRMMKPADIAQTILDAVALPERAMISELDIRPTNP